VVTSPNIIGVLLGNQTVFAQPVRPGRHVHSKLGADIATHGQGTGERALSPGA